ncbi:MAG TPA: DUF456 family protein [Burkholderiaceae bacterium]|jgi:uncharacterized protein YqgC (DUF456 family)|nr:DUF456 family protein [Burkholderiaceae bacterium]
MDTLLWLVAAALIGLGVAGVVLPALPGIAFVYGGIVLGAWIGDFQRVGVGTLVVLGVLAAIGMVVDYVATTIAAQRAGASKQGLIGAALGTVAGVFTGLVGLVFMPLAGAAIGEYLARRDALRAGKVGLATWFGLVLGTVAKLGIVFAMLGVFVAALLL